MIKYKVVKYTAEDLLSDLLCNNYPMLLVINRFGIALGCGEQTVAGACEGAGVDVDTFLAVVNTLNAEHSSSIEIDYERVSLSALIDYLKSSHSYYLDYRLPSIREKLIEALPCESDPVSEAIVSYFDCYVLEVRSHMEEEERVLFPYIRKVTSGEQSTDYTVDTYSKHHDKIESKLTELKSIMIKYYPSQTTNELLSVLYDIFSCERDLALHNTLEDYLLVPAMKSFETTNTI